MGQRLHGLAEPHIVGEDAAELVGAQELQPVEPLALIGTQLRLQPGRRLDLVDPCEARQAFGQCLEPLAAEPAQSGRSLDRGEAQALAGGDFELARGGEASRVIELDQGRQDRLGPVERQRDMPAVGEPAEDRTVMRQAVEFVRRAGNAQPGQEPGQHRQQRHPLAVDFDPEIEREPPAAVFLDLGRPLAAAVDDPVAEAVLDVDPPTLALELRHRVINKARPVASAIQKAEGNSAGVLGSRAEGLDGAQPERCEPVLR